MIDLNKDLIALIDERITAALSRITITVGGAAAVPVHRRGPGRVPKAKAAPAPTAREAAPSRKGRRPRMTDAERRAKAAAYQREYRKRHLAKMRARGK